MQLNSGGAAVFATGGANFLGVTGQIAGAKLASGAVIGPTGAFSANGAGNSLYKTVSSLGGSAIAAGNFANSATGFVGIKLASGNFGWIRLHVEDLGINQPFAGFAAGFPLQDGDGVQVMSCERINIDVGTTSRVWLKVEHDGPPGLARRWFVKLPSASWKARAITALPQLAQTEVRFYRELSRRVRIRHPRALAAQNCWGRGFMLVLADLTEAGALTGSPGDSLSIDQARRMVDLLSALHASHWEHPHLDKNLAWLGGPVRRLEARLGSVLAVPLMKRGLARAQSAVPESLHEDAICYARRRRAVHAYLGAGPRTLVHHDCHAGNLYWVGEKPGLLDWQLVRIGEGVGDLAYLLATTLQPEVRRIAECDLLARYEFGLRCGGVPARDLSGLMDRYRAHMTYAFEAVVVTLAVGGLMADEVAKELCRRAACAVADLESFAACTTGMNRL